jgi:signal transduction histidine kinase
MVRGSIRARSIALFVGYVLALCVVYIAFTVHVIRRETWATHDRLAQTAGMVAAEVDAHLEAGRQRLATVAALPGLVYGLRSIQERSNEGPIAPWTTLHYLFFRSPVFTAGVFLVDTSGTVLWTEPPGLPWLGRSLADLEPVQKALRARATVVSDVLLAGPHVVVALPIGGAEGEVAGVLGGVVDLRAAEFAGFLARLSTTDEHFAAITDAGGRTLATTAGRGLLGAWQPPDEEEAPLLAAAPLTTAHWRVVAGQPRATALGHIWHLQWILLGIGTVILLAAVVIGGTFVRGVVRAVDRLTGHAAVMARGDLSQPVAVDTGHEEIASLARTFERMRVELERSQLALEQRLEERDELIRLKEEFLANVSHELRTPLHVIVGYTDMLAESQADTEGQDALARIRTQSERLLRLLGDLMTLSGISTGKLAVTQETVAARDLLKRLVPLVDRLRQGKPIEVEWDCPLGLPTLHTDASRLEQVLTNLVTNAFKFTERGRIAIRVRHEAEVGHLVFEVADTGIGIPADELPFVFDEFRQVDGSMSRHHEGMGLGLALVKRLVELLGGEVAVTSRAGEGSCFTVVLPTTPALRAAAGG